jgi:hypothetical protein
MSNDSSFFIYNENNTFPLYEVKMIYNFDHRYATYLMHSESPSDVSLSEKQNRLYSISPNIWIDNKTTIDRFTRWFNNNDLLDILDQYKNWFMVYRGVTNASNERTMIPLFLFVPLEIIYQ